MNKEEIKEYLKRVDELEFKLVDEDKDTLQWLIFGYNECARLLNEKEKENQRLKAIEKENKELQDRIDNGFKEIKELYDLYKEENCYTISDKLENALIMLKGDKK